MFLLTYLHTVVDQTQLAYHTNRMLSWFILFESSCQRNRRHDCTTTPLLRLLTHMYRLGRKMSIWNKTFKVAHNELLTKTMYNCYAQRSQLHSPVNTQTILYRKQDFERFTNINIKHPNSTHAGGHAHGTHPLSVHM